jgi:hypothetical protein
VVTGVVAGVVLLMTVFVVFVSVMSGSVSRVILLAALPVTVIVVVVIAVVTVFAVFGGVVLRIVRRRSPMRIIIIIAILLLLYRSRWVILFVAILLLYRGRWVILFVAVFIVFVALGMTSIGLGSMSDAVKSKSGRDGSGHLGGSDEGDVGHEGDKGRGDLHYGATIELKLGRGETRERQAWVRVKRRVMVVASERVGCRC